MEFDPGRFSGLKLGLPARRLARRRALYAHALYSEGMTLKDLAPRLGVTSAEGARLQVLKGQRILDREYAHVGEACGLVQLLWTAQQGGNQWADCWRDPAKDRYLTDEQMREGK